MSDDRKVMKAGLIAAALLIVIRILLEQAGASGLISSIFGVVWLYFLIPVLFAFGIRTRAYAKPYGRLLRDIVLFAVYTRVMVAITYILAYYLKWTTPRFSAARGGTVGPEVKAWQALLLIPVRNAILWVVIATIVGIAVGSITFLLNRKKTVPG